MSSKKLILLALISSLVLVPQVSARRIASDLVSDGASRIENVGQVQGEEEGSVCEQTYGFMPCTDTGLGNLFLIIVYGYLMYVGATYLSDGSELLLDILGPGIIGGLFLPVLGALPDALLILGNSAPSLPLFEFKMFEFRTGCPH